MAAKKTNEEEKKVTKKTTTKKVEEPKVETKTETNDKETISGLSRKAEIVLVYIISFVGFIFALMKDKKVSKSQRFHYNQAGTLWIVNIILSVGFGIVSAFVPFAGSISKGINVVLWIFAIIAMIKAYNEDEDYKIPVIYDISKSIFGSTED